MCKYTKINKEVIPGKDATEKVIVRLYGNESAVKTFFTAFIPELHEVVVSQTLSLLGLGPKVFGIFEGGLIEEFVDVSKTRKGIR